MVSYAAVPMTRDTVTSLFGHVAEVPDGQARLTWALFRFPWKKDCDYFFIGGNYLNLTQPDYNLQILTKDQLDSWFEYDEKVLNRKFGPRPEGRWFVVKVRKGVVFAKSKDDKEEEPLEACSG